MANGDNRLKGTALNGYKVRSWGDLIAVASVLAMLLSVVAWGLKLEGELNAVRTEYGNRIAAIEVNVARGVLPRAEERIDSLRRDLNYLAKELEKIDRDNHRNSGSN